MKLDRKLLLIVPAVVLVLVVAGMVYAAVQLHVLSSVSETFKERSDFIAAVERGEKPLDAHQALDIIHVQFDVETKRSAALVAARDLLVVLSTISLASLAVLGAGIRAVPREHWPKLTFRRKDSP